ncbi:hypothetical protein N7457_003240 [Penicillium paradoxum]|uniref:uncharacterized protein n=1 Tax=Penicillium paradoxum TaxID=176176 RepID=UPI002548F8B1|nr:uncharacterized protein N7457_003240 [Penicillium paradoxum]KAJ5788250.1 hypothetical protein N7457_003240 [Penicillium paradoxum]
MGNSNPTEPAPAYEELFHAPGASSRNGYAIVNQTDAADEHRDVEQGHRHHNGPIPFERAVVGTEPNQHIHCSECDRQRERKERQENERKTCAIVARTFILIILFLVFLGVVALQAWKEVRMKKLKSHD